MRVMTEFETLAQASTRSLSRFGDGELRVALGGSAVSQEKDAKLAAELCAILRGPTRSLVCLPRQDVGPKADRWKDYARPKYAALMGQDVYGSAFITRPDSAPCINVEDYWLGVRRLWTGKHTTLLVGSDYGSLREENLRHALSVRTIIGPRRDAYRVIDDLEQDICTSPGHVVIMCLGCAATVLAERLAVRGIHALDLGHIGKFTPEQYR